MEPVTEPTTLELVDACLAGEQAGPRALYERFARRVRFLAARIVGESDADDVVQNVFLQVFRCIGQFRRDSRFETWLYRLAVNEALQHRRRNQRWPVAPLPLEELPSSRGGASQCDDRELIELALQTLPEELRLLFVLREVDELSYRELGEIAGVPEGTVASRLYRARVDLRQRMIELGWGERT
ncbi:MAG: sigma-70 family RNA polymerase sigma factor [Pirellulales bacterium]